MKKMIIDYVEESPLFFITSTSHLGTLVEYEGDSLAFRVVAVGYRSKTRFLKRPFLNSVGRQPLICEQGWSWVVESVNYSTTRITLVEHERETGQW